MKDLIAIISGLISLAVSVSCLYMTSHLSSRIDNLHKQTDSSATAIKQDVVRISARLDSAKKIEKELAKTIIYVDSIQTSKAAKSDRAERRGKFVGGLLKALIPSL